MISPYSNSKIYMIYHCPCLDGTFTLMNMMMIIRTKVSLDHWTYNRLYKHIETYLLNVYDKPVLQPNIEEQKQQYPNRIDEGFVSGSILDDIIYVPMAQKVYKDYLLEFCDTGTSTFRESILIMLDYCGRSIDVIQKLAKTFKYVIILDNSQTSIDQLCFIPNFDQQNTQMQALSKKLYVMVDASKISSQIAINFCENLFGMNHQSLLPEPVYIQMKLLTKHIIDHTKFLKANEETAPLISAIMHHLKNSEPSNRRGPFFEHDVNKYPIFFKLYNINFDAFVDMGKDLRIHANERLKQALPHKKLFKIQGYKCYGIMSEDFAIMNELGQQLSILSERDGLDNFAIIYHINKHRNYHEGMKNPYIVVDLRSNQNGIKSFSCNNLAEQFGGGGNIASSSYQCQLSDLLTDQNNNIKQSHKPQPKSRNQKKKDHQHYLKLQREAKQPQRYQTTKQVPAKIPYQLEVRGGDIFSQQENFGGSSRKGSSSVTYLIKNLLK